MKFSTDDFRVEHRAQSVARALRLSAHFEDYTVPFVEHCFDVYPNDYSDIEDLDDPNSERLDPEKPIARLLINEFPLHMATASRDMWFWLFDKCDRGTPEELGSMLDRLEEDGELDLMQNSGAVFHLQSVQVLPEMRRLGIASALTEYALGLLSRSNYDLAIATADDSTSAAFPRLIEAESFSDDAGEDESYDAEAAMTDPFSGGEAGGGAVAIAPVKAKRDLEVDAMREFLTRNGFQEWVQNEPSAVEVSDLRAYALQFIQGTGPTGCFYRQLKRGFRRKAAAYRK